jgi:hypothetical protein
MKSNPDRTCFISRNISEDVRDIHLQRPMNPKKSVACGGQLRE